MANGKNFEDLDSGECILGSDGFAHCKVNGDVKKFKIADIEG